MNKLVSIFAPMTFLSFFTLYTFTMQEEANDKVTVLATVFLAYVAFIPSLRNETPSFSYMTLPDLYIFCCLLANLESLVLTFLEKQGKINDDIQLKFLIVCLLLLFVPVLIIAFYLVRYLFIKIFTKKRKEDFFFDKRIH